MEQVMQLYRKIEPPAWQMSLGLLHLNGDEVMGRDKDIQKIEAKLWAEGKLVLHGFSGIGKTKLVTLLGHKWQRNYPCSQVYYAFYPGSMTGPCGGYAGAEYVYGGIYREEGRKGRPPPCGWDH